jgi:hypothetical protein
MKNINFKKVNGKNILRLKEAWKMTKSVMAEK